MNDQTCILHTCDFATFCQSQRDEIYWYRVFARIYLGISIFYRDVELDTETETGSFYCCHLTEVVLCGDDAGLW